MTHQNNTAQAMLGPLRRVAEVSGRIGAAYRALRAGDLMEQAGKPAAYYNTGSDIRPGKL